MADSKDWTGGNAFISRVYASKSTDETQKAYDEWAAIYDKDMVDAEYESPAIVASEVIKYAGADGKILDAGCGTGLVGIQLSKLGAKAVDGNDLSPGMLEIARKTGAYQDLNAVDLSQKLDIAEVPLQSSCASSDLVV
ncbi:hypothetical protein KC319_g11971 [Hortaea werneckii]|nr:hypothetical protein KC319_g11971 [Hortaea werneckii]